MGKGGYNGGSSVVGFGGSFTGAPRRKLSSAIDLDAHQSMGKRDAARETAGRTPKGKAGKGSKLTKAERKADALARQSYKAAPRQVEVEHRLEGVVVHRRVVERS